jgi:hypothetical protein
MGNRSLKWKRILEAGSRSRKYAAAGSESLKRKREVKPKVTAGEENGKLNET